MHGLQFYFSTYIKDPVPPTFLSCPAEIYAYEDELIRWDEPRAQDNVGVQYLWSNIDQGEPLGAGDHTVTYTAVDYDDNQAMCEFNVYVYNDGKIFLVLYEPHHEKTCLRVCDQVRLKPACSATETS